jgi:alpha-tubulin suppressor-like RCC1 family protein
VQGGLLFASVSAGYRYACGIATDGQSYCWGQNGYGQLGSYDTQRHYIPTLVVGGLTFKQLVAGAFTTCATTMAGTPYCWGFNEGGQIGNGTLNSDSLPRLVTGGLTMTTIDRSCGISTENATYCWGTDYPGAPSGGRSTTPVAVDGGHTFRSISAATYGACAVTAEPLVYCWGADKTGSLGNGAAGASTAPVRVLYQP